MNTPDDLLEQLVLRLHSRDSLDVVELAPVAGDAGQDFDATGLDLDTNGPSSGGNASDLDDNDSGLDDNGPSLDGNGPDLDGRAPAAPESFPELASVWERLASGAAGFRATKRAHPDRFDAAVLELCAQTALTISELMTLLDRRPSQTRSVVRRLVADGRPTLLYADRPNSPKQRYTIPQ